MIVQSTGGGDKTGKLGNAGMLVKTGGTGLWTGAGIVSSNAAAESAHYGVGVFDNALAGKLTSGGQAVDGNSILVAVAHLGDANDNGLVDIQDQSIVTNHWQSAQNNWAGGDLNLWFCGPAGSDAGDQQLAAGQRIFGSPGAGLTAVGGVAGVPEPASLSIAGVMGLAMLMRGRRQKRG